MKKSFWIFSIIALVAICGCSSRQKSVEPQKFQRPNVPKMITDNQQAFAYIAQHYWDKFFDENREYPKDTSLVAGITKHDFETAFAEYATFLDAVSVSELEKAQARLAQLAEKAELRDPQQQFWTKISDLADKYLNDPNSPYRTEEGYLAWLKAAVNTSVISPDKKLVAESIIPYLSLNRIGSKGADFPFTLPNGVSKHLYDYNTDYVILLVSNSDCNSCKDITDVLKEAELIDNLISEGRLTIINLYPDDDVQAWKEYLPTYPSHWVNGWDKSDEFESKYYLRAIPSLYLFGKDFTVIAKDATIEKVMNHLVQNTTQF